MPPKWNLQADEWVVMKGEAGAHHREPARFLAQNRPAPPQELILTNRNIVVISKNMFGKPKGVRHLPLSQVRVVEGRPQVFSAEKDGSHLLEVYFNDGQEAFAFARKKEQRAWADNLAKLLTGSSDEFSPARNKAIPGAAYLAESLKDTFGAVKGTFSSKSDSKRTARRCTGCNATISGFAGRVVQCTYCGSDQEL